jgi:predicted metalloendopeptidase
VQQLAKYRKSLLIAVLGCVLAHEIGHLLLNGGGHATSGLMKAYWMKKDLSLIEQRTFRFLPAQAEEMVRSLEERRLFMRSSNATW